MTWLGVDLGDARVGLALSDRELSLAHPIGNIQSHGDSFHALADVLDVIRRERVDTVVIGLPLQLDGYDGSSARKARRWAANLTKRLEGAPGASDAEQSMPHAPVPHAPIPHIVLLDERLTTVSAHRQLRDAMVSSRRHRPIIDQQSAVLILQMALDRRRE